MPVAKLDIDATLVARLIETQFPQWADLSVEPVANGGWDNRTFRLGPHMLVRLPSAGRYAMQVDKEQRWLPRLAPLLPLPIPAPLAMGYPAEGYPWHWSVYRWLEGESAIAARIGNPMEFAAALARFLAALQAIDPAEGPAPGPQNFFRGGPLTTYDGEVRRAIAILGERIDVRAVAIVWEAALAAAWRGEPVWFHGDVSESNLLVTKGRLSAVIDFGSSGVGDPACDLVITWTLLSGEGRDAFRAALHADAAMWARGRGWALWKALITLEQHIHADPGEGAKARFVIAEVLADHRAGKIIA